MAHPFLGIVIVTYNSERTIVQTLDSVLLQSQPADRIIVVDCGSTRSTWMEKYQRQSHVTLVREKNLGYVGGNNLGWSILNPKAGFVLILNPDVILPLNALEKMTKLFEEPASALFGVISPRLHSFSFVEHRSTGAIDSTGIFPNWWGAWRDRRESSPPEKDILEEVPALCGAFLLARVEALRAVMLPGELVFDPRYFAYKEDIELSLRLRRNGWKLGMWHSLVAWHGRGWLSNRTEMPFNVRWLSVLNEVRLHATYAWWKLPYSLLKLATVWLFRM